MAVSKRTPIDGASSIRELVAKFLDEARSRGEAWIAGTRILISTFVILRTCIANTAALLRGEMRPCILVSVCAASGIYSASVWYRARRGTLRPRVMWASILADAVPLGVAILTEILHPEAGFAGTLRSPEFGFILLAMAATALRFSPRLVVFGGVIYSAMLVAFVVIDAPTMRVNFVPLCVTSAICFLATAIIAYALAHRVETLVQDGATTAVRAERARQHLGAYISTELARDVMEKDELNFIGEQREVAILFSDLRGFTRYAESLAPSQLVRELNAYLNAMLPVIHAEGGVVDKYIGDSIMVVFGLPKSRPDDAARAISAARAMQRALREHNSARARLRLAPLVQGIGIHYGSVVAGNIGTPERLQYTVVGDVVNLASRIESATKDHNVAVLMTGTVVDAAMRSGAALPPLKALGSIAIRGRQAPIEVLSFNDDGVTADVMLP